jgi:glycosyltransferase involved in cell wall biosynthesis
MNELPLLQEATMQLSVIVPARNEADCIRDCLVSLIRQSEQTFALGRDWELLVVDDDSTDDTRRVAEKLGGSLVLTAPSLPRGWMGKNNAVWFAAQKARGRWLLFTDADTVHEPGGLLRAMHEVEKHKAALLSYSPRQIVRGFWQRALMPLVFSDLATVYPPAKVNDPAARIAAANGQFLLVERNAYFAVGGHKAVSGSMLEDVALATKFKQAHQAIRFRYAPDEVAAHMYRSLLGMLEGWTKNLALLFPQPLLLATFRMVDFFLLVGLPLMLWLLPQLALVFWWAKVALVLIWLRTLVRYFVRVARSHFSAFNCILSIAGLPLFSLLLARAWFRKMLRKPVRWKGRSYGKHGNSGEKQGSNPPSPRI